MTMDELAFCLEPLPLADGALALPHLYRLRQQGLPSPDREIVELRLIDMLRRLSPEIALELLRGFSGAPPPDHPTLHPTALQAWALVEAGQTGDATLLLPDVSPVAGVRDLLSGRISVHDGLATEAQALLERAVARARADRPRFPLAVEVEVEARSVLARLRLGLREDVTDELALLDELCGELGAGITQSLHRVWAEAARRGLLPMLADAGLRIAFTQVQARYTFGFEADRAAVAPIPLHVHGAARTHAQDPKAYTNAILTLSSLAWRAGFDVEAYETAWYGARIADKLFPPRDTRDLRAFLDGLPASVGEARWSAAREGAERRARPGGTPKTGA